MYKEVLRRLAMLTHLREKLNSLTHIYVELREYQEEIKLLQSLRFIQVSERDLKAITESYKLILSEYRKLDREVTEITNHVVGILNCLENTNIKNPYGELSRSGREKLFYRLNQKRTKKEEKIVYELLLYEFGWNIPAKGTPPKRRSGKRVKVSLNQLALEETLKRLKQ